MSSNVSLAVAMARQEAHACVKPKDLKPSLDIIMEAFNQTCRDGSGLLRTRELQVAMRSIGYDMSRDQATNLVQNSQNCKDGGAGGITPDDFIDLVQAAEVQAQQSHKDMTNLFLLYKGQKQLFASTRITLDELLKVRDEVSPQTTDQQVADMYNAAHRATDAKQDSISLEAFDKVMRMKGFFLNSAPLEESPLGQLRVDTTTFL